MWVKDIVNLHVGARVGVLVTVILLFTLNLAGGQQSQTDGCAFTFNNPYNVSETAPAGTEIVRITTLASVTWTSAVTYSSNMPVNVTRGHLLDAYVNLQRQNGADYVLTVNKMLDLEDIKAKLGVAVTTLSLQLTCQNSGQPDENQDVFVDILPVNEFYPEFLGSPFNVTLSEAALIGTKLIQLEDVSRDLDVGPWTSELFAYSLVPYDFASVNGKPEDDGRDYFTMSNLKTGRIELTQTLDFEELQRAGRTTLWLNVTAQDHSGNKNWTTIKVTVTDDDDQGPEFYVASVCDSAVYPAPPCPITYKVKVLVNTTGIVNKIEPAPIFAHDRDTIDNPITYILKDSAGAVRITSRFALNETTGVLEVVSPFVDTGVFSLYVEAQEVSSKASAVQATLQVDVYSPEYDPWEVVDVNTPGPTAKAKEDTTVAVIGISVLGVICVGLVIALFLTCLKLRKHRQGRVGSADTSRSSTKSFVDDDEDNSLPASKPNPILTKQDEVLKTLPVPGQRGSRLPPLPQQPSSGDVFDGTKTFKDSLTPDFFTAPGKVKVPRLPPVGSKSQEKQPIIIDDSGSASP